MNLKQLFGEDRAVSPVIGVILMVAITVILAAVIGTFVLGLGDKVSTTTPQANFQFDYTNNNPGNDTLEIAHSGGDSIKAGQVNVTSTKGYASNASSFNGTSSTWAGLVDGTSAGDKISAGSSVTINAGSLSAETIRVVWTSESGDSSAVLGKWSGPDA